MYADDTKIWREIKIQDDNWILQSDINRLLDWANSNIMKFHPSKSKVLAVSSANSVDHIFTYTLNQVPIVYTDSEKDLGVHINSKMNWSEHSDIIYSKANQKLGLLKRTCSFVSNMRKRRTLYLTQVRSQFEHCPIVWRPFSKSSVERLDSIQKRGIKWVLNEVYESYSEAFTYFRKCKQLNILPIATRFDLKDLTFFHSVFYDYSMVSLPHYLKRFTHTRLRSSHLDSLSIISDITPRMPQNVNSVETNLGISKSFFYRAHLTWNRLPYKLCEITSPGKFKIDLTDYLWKELLGQINDGTSNLNASQELEYSFENEVS